MKLYYHPVSITSRPLALFIADQALEVELEVVDILKGEHHSEAFAAKNPNKLVPLIEDGDFLLTESSAMLKYLADKHGLTGMYPTELQARARVNERMDWFNTGFYREYGYHLVYPQIFPNHKREGAAQQAILDWGVPRCKEALRVLNDHVLGDNPYVCGQSVTIADFFGVCLVTAGEHIRVDFSAYPNIQAWIERMKARSSWAATHAAHEGLRGMLAEQEFVTP